MTRIRKYQILLLAAAAMAAPAAHAATVGLEGARKTGQRIAAGSSHACAVRGNGDVRCWGNNDYGQLGDNTVTERLSPVWVVDLTSAIAVAAGDDHTCALRADGRVRCWGRNDFGQLGDGSTDNRFSPVTVSGLEGVVSLSAGRSHTCAVKVSGQVRCWGKNANGQLGNASTTNSSVPVTVADELGPALAGALEVALGNNHSCALLYNGNVTCWGLNNDGQAGFATVVGPVPQPGDVFSTSARLVSSTGQAVLLTAGANHTCIVRADRGLRCWGDNANGQLGDNSLTDSQNPVSVASGPLNVTGISAGIHHTCLLRVDATVSCWGSNAQGQFGDGTTIAQLTPATVASNLSYPVAIASHNRFNCALLADGEVRCWGGNDKGQVGDGIRNNNRLTAVNALPAGNNKAAWVAAGGRNRGHTCALRSSGLVDCWGDAAASSALTPNPALPISGLANITQVANGNDFSCALRADGRIYCWGNNASGQLGNGTNTGSTSPIAVSSIFDAVAISAGSRHACAAKVGGGVRCWGANAEMQLGDGTTVDRNSPVIVTALNDAVMVSAGDWRTCALAAEGRVSCWGTATPVNPGPVFQPVVRDAVAVAAGDRHVCYRIIGGTVMCVGEGGQGQLGRGQAASSFIYATVPGLETVVAVVGRDRGTCALLVDGTAQCWGDNEFGQIGDGTAGPDRLSPTPVAGVSGLLSLAPGIGHHSCGVSVSGIPYCWGRNEDGQVGDGTTTQRPAPVAVPTF